MQRLIDRLGSNRLGFNVLSLTLALGLAACGSDQKEPEEPDGPMEEDADGAEAHRAEDHRRRGR